MKRITSIIKKKANYILLFLIIICAIFMFSYKFYNQKQDYHSDEIWSYGLANSSYQPFIYMNADQTKNTNCEEWLPGTILSEYITVQEDNAFNYSSVYFNMSNDTHPPLYFMILHTICSLFKNSFSFTYGFIINIISYIILAIFMYKLVSLITNSKYWSLICVGFFSFGIGCLSMTSFVRMYSMCTMFAVILAYYHTKLYYSIKNSVTFKLIDWISLSLCTLLGSLTHHFFLVYAFAYAVIFCIYFLITKKWKFLYKYALCMAGGVILSIMVFPATINHLLGTTHPNSMLTFPKKIYGYKFQWFALLSILLDELFGFSIVSPYERPTMAYIIAALIIILIISVAISFLFRKEKWFKKLVSKIKNKLKSLVRSFIHPNIIYISFLCAIILVISVCAHTVNYYHMREFSDRYLFIVYPIATILLFSIIYSILQLLNVKKRTSYIFITCFSIVLLAIANIRLTSPYISIGSYKIGISMEDISNNDNDVIIVSSETWLLTVYSYYLKDVNSFFYVEDNNLYYTKDELEKKNETQKPTYLIIDGNIFDLVDVDIDPNPNNTIYLYTSNEINTNDNINAQIYQAQKAKYLNDSKEDISLEGYLSFIQSLSFCNNLEFVGIDSAFTRPLILYKIN